MRNEIESLKTLPYFTISALKGIIKNNSYLKILLSRYTRAGKLLRLKKGMYVTRTFIEACQRGKDLSDYLEFLSNVLYDPSYLSLEYVLNKHNALTEVPMNFTAVTLHNKTKHFSNDLGVFIYRRLKKELFCGFVIHKRSAYKILEATKAKALFDFIYLRKNLLMDDKAVEELRIRTEVFDKGDKEELKKYLELSHSERLDKIFNWLFPKICTKKS
jgi:predicted transcriptional regulator of viral defense system